MRPVLVSFLNTHRNRSLFFAMLFPAVPAWSISPMARSSPFLAPRSDPSIAVIVPQPWLPDDRTRSFPTASATLTLHVAPVVARACACAGICWAASNRFPGLAFGADRPPCDTPHPGLDSRALCRLRNDVVEPVPGGAGHAYPGTAWRAVARRDRRPWAWCAPRPSRDCPICREQPQRCLTIMPA